MEWVSSIVAFNPGPERERIAALLSREGLTTAFAGSPDEVAELVRVGDVGLILVSDDLEGGPVFGLCERVRRVCGDAPPQIIYAIHGWGPSAGIDLAPEYLVPANVMLYDDIVVLPIDETELRTRVRIARARHAFGRSVLLEREFYRKAARMEEELTSEILEQHEELKRAWQSAEIEKTDLEFVNRELRHVARFDSLSGLLNRVSLFSMVDVEIERAERTGAPLAGIMADIDRFKSINDTYGHQCGDRVIRMFGQALRSQLRKYDHAGRYGGEEFFVVLPNTSLSQARRFADRIRMVVGKSVLDECDGTLAVTASFGIAQFIPGESRDLWIRRADLAMYAAKRNGRNRVEAAPPNAVSE